MPSDCIRLKQGDVPFRYIAESRDKVCDTTTSTVRKNIFLYEMNAKPLPLYLMYLDKF